MSKVNVLSIQFQPKIGKKDFNLQKAKSIIENNKHLNPDLIVLPEFFNTGISLPAFKKLAEPVEKNETVAFFKDVARDLKSYLLVGSIMELENGKLYNTSRLLDRKGDELAMYRKVHLFDSFGGEEHLYCKPGDRYVTVDTDFGKVGLSVCFDIRFSLQHVELVKQGAEIILETAAWSCLNSDLEQYVENWTLLNRTRALDNKVYFISSNLCGKVDSSLTSCGYSMICAPDGRIVANAKDLEGCAFAQIDTDYVKECRSQFNMKNLWKTL